MPACVRPRAAKMSALVTSRKRLVRLEEAMRAESARMYDALGNALVIEMEDLLAKMEVFESRRAARADAQRVLIVRNRRALLRRERRDVAAGRLMSSPADTGIVGFLCFMRPSRPRNGSVSRPIPTVARLKHESRVRCTVRDVHLWVR